ncbi:helix-turn-helix domain-containing protein [Hymenobacter crusticola]|uniref:Transposase n=1 Tax=Hymenobacter crusticola TaxID=1770526 RepID=A0A243W6E7_9BACT|nr:hypothetical protein [Hymenobacter crusticola]OUJ69893.1 hypothetical protein BXP70_25860 [Hymenobacter crusticola]
MIDKSTADSSAATYMKYTPAFKAYFVRQVAAGARQSDVACAQGILLGRWQRQALKLSCTE